MKRRRLIFWGGFGLGAAIAFFAIFRHYYAKPVADYLIKQGTEQYIHTNPYGAISYYSWAALFDPHNGDAYFHRGEERLRVGDIRGALSDYDLAVETGTGGGFFLSQRAEFKIHLKDYAGAMADLDANIKKHEYGDPEDHYTRGCLNLVINKPADAMEDFNKAIEEFPEDGESLRARAQMEYADGRAKEAVADLRKAFAAWPPKMFERLLLWLAEYEDPTARAAADQELADYIQASSPDNDSSLKIAFFLTGKLSQDELLPRISAGGYPDELLFVAAKAYFSGDLATARACVQQCKTGGENGEFARLRVEFWKRRLQIPEEGSK